MIKRLFLCSFFFFLSASYNPLDEDVLPHYQRGLFSKIKKILIKKSLQASTENTATEESNNTSKELIVDLRNPYYLNGILVTHEGGVIQNEDIRIQAKVIQYTHREENGKKIHHIEAEKDLMVQYKGRVYVGEELEYDFIEGKGVIYNGKTYVSPWYIGGDVIHLKNDGSYRVKNVFITTCENKQAGWDIHADKVEVLKKDLLSASQVKFRFFTIPAIWLPSFKMNLKKFFSTPICKYSLDWDKGPRASVRYQMYSWKDFLLFGRVDYRLKRGFGGAIETSYHPDHQRIHFDTKNYLGSDIIPNVPVKKRRYRLQGVYRYISEAKKTTMDLTWDKYSDINMPNDFKSDDFELDTAKKTEFFLHHTEPNFLSQLHARARVNTFETLKQDLPSLFLSSKPCPLFANLLCQNDLKVSYIDYAYSHDLIPHLPDLHGWRCEISPLLFKTFTMKRWQITPSVKAKGIFYSHTPTNTPIVLATMQYDVLALTKLLRKYNDYTHRIIPYLQLEGWTHPTQSIHEHYIYSLQDGFYQINMFKIGAKNQIYRNNIKSISPFFSSDLYFNMFLPDYHLQNIVPKIYLDCEWNLDNFTSSISTAWNFTHQTVDFFDFQFGWTVNEDIAMRCDFLYRSRYDWRKSNHDNFILNVARKEHELLLSPLSDQRNTVLFHIFFRLTPFWSCHFESHHGFNRLNEPGYNEFKAELFTTISTSWRINISYQHTQRDDRVSAGYCLLKK